MEKIQFYLRNASLYHRNIVCPSDSCGFLLQITFSLFLTTGNTSGFLLFNFPQELQTSVYRGFVSICQPIPWISVTPRSSILQNNFAGLLLPSLFNEIIFNYSPPWTFRP